MFLLQDARRGGLSADLDDFEITQGVEKLTLYTFNTGAAKHSFCSICGIYPHHQRRSNPNEFGINTACLDGISPFDFAEIIVHDGVNHSNDAPEADPVAGYLRFSNG